MSKKPGFKMWDSVTLQESEKHALQFKSMIESLSVENRTEVQDLPDSLVPTDVLYYMAACYDAMYNMLLERDLVETGNLRGKSNNIH